MATGQPSAFAAGNTNTSRGADPNAITQSKNRFWVGSEPRTPTTGQQSLYAGAPEKLSGQVTPIAQVQKICAPPLGISGNTPSGISDGLVSRPAGGDKEEFKPVLKLRVDGCARPSPKRVVAQI